MLNPAKLQRRLAKDESGGLLVIGIVMGMLMVGILWYMASIGDAILWREQAQDAADAAAYQNAVWNARGMNLLVMLNMLMALVMAVLVIWRLLIATIITVMAIIAIACAIGFLIPNPISTVACSLTRVAVRLTSTLDRMRRIDDTISKNVARITHAMATSQKVIAGAIPPIGAVISFTDTVDAFDVSAAWTFSTSALPNVEGDGVLGVNTKNPGLECDERADKYEPRDFLAPRIGYGFSLPAQEEVWSVLCLRAAQVVPNNIAAVLERTGAPEEFVAVFDKISGIVGPIVGSLPTVFCAPNSSGIPQAALDVVDGVAKDVCDKHAAPVMVNGEKKYKVPDDKKPGEFVAGKYADKFDMKGCLAGQAKKSGAGMGKVGSKNNKKPTCSKPFKVWDYAANGNIAMQSFSFVDKEARMLGRDDKGLEVGDGPETGNVSEVDPPWIRAQAEMYYDCEAVWETCRQNAPWTLNWRARLRRIQRIEDMAVRAGERVMVESLVNGANKMLGRAAKNALTNRGFPDIISENVKDTWATQQLRNAARRAAYNTIGGRLFLSPPDGPVVIH